MTYDESERVERCIHGITFMANASEMRRVMAAVIASDEWRQWSWRDDLIKSHGAGEYHRGAMEDMLAPRVVGDPSRKPAGLHWVCIEAASWFQKLSAVTMREVEAMEAER